MSKLKVIKQAFDYFIDTNGANTDFHTVMPLAKYFARALWDCFNEKINRKIAIKPLDEYDFWTKSKCVLITLFDQYDDFASDLEQKYVDVKERLAYEKAIALIKEKYPFDGKFLNDKRRAERDALFKAEMKKEEEVSFADEVDGQVKYWQKQMLDAQNKLENTNENNHWRCDELRDDVNNAEKQLKHYKTMQESLSEIRKLDKDGNVDKRESYDGPMIAFADTLLTPSIFEDIDRFQIDQLKFNPDFLERLEKIINSKGYQYDNIEVVARQIVIEIANARTIAELFPTEEQENIFNMRKTTPQTPQNFNYQQQSIFDESEQ